MSPGQYERSRWVLSGLLVGALVSLGVCVFVSWWSLPLVGVFLAFCLGLSHGCISRLVGHVRMHRGSICYRCAELMPGGGGGESPRCGHVATDRERVRIEAILSRGGG